MTHTIYIDDTVIIRRKYEVPECCPRCKEAFELGEAVLKSRHLWPRNETLMLTTLIEGATKREVVQVKDTPSYGPQTHMLTELRCHRCDYLLAAAHSRQYVLAEMNRLMAFKLRGLLYDSNAKDETVQRKCFEETQGYHGDCEACNFETELGDEEVPHPIDPHAHSCVREENELNKSR